MTTDLPTLARAAVAKNTDGGHSRKLRAVRDLRIAHIATGARALPLDQYLSAVEEAMRQPPLDLDRVAKAVFDALAPHHRSDVSATWGGLSEAERDYYRTCARAALTAAGVAVPAPSDAGARAELAAAPKEG